MKWLSSAVVWLSLFAAQGQGGFIYDQQSSTDETGFAGAGTTIQDASPFGQSFVPTFSAMTFIRLNLNDFNTNNSLGVTLFLNLRTNNMSGNILAATLPVTLKNGFAGPTNFFFSADLPVTPAATYLFEIVVQSGDFWNVLAGDYNYPNGTAFYQGRPSAGDLWFREGVVPEPSSAGLILLSAVALAFVRRLRANVG